MISGAATNLPGSPQPMLQMGAMSNLVFWVGTVLYGATKTGFFVPVSFAEEI